MINNRETGTKYENRAAEYLELNGYQILNKNFRCKIGEIDLIARKEQYLCFIEVKYRSDTKKGFPAEAITPTKIRRITKTAQFYMLTHHLSPDLPCRFDAVVILGDRIELIQNAFDAI